MKPSPTITLAELRKITAALRKMLRQDTTEFRRIFKIALAELEHEVEKHIRERKS